MKFEYLKISFSELKTPYFSEIETMNEYGEEGWELITVIGGGDCIFKRVKTE